MKHSKNFQWEHTRGRHSLDHLIMNVYQCSRLMLVYVAESFCNEYHIYTERQEQLWLCSWAQFCRRKWGMIRKFKKCVYLAIFLPNVSLIMQHVNESLLEVIESGCKIGGYMSLPLPPSKLCTCYYDKHGWSSK